MQAFWERQDDVVLLSCQLHMHASLLCVHCSMRLSTGTGFFSSHLPFKERGRMRHPALSCVRHGDEPGWMCKLLAHPGCAMQGHPLYSSKAVRFTFSCGVRPKRFTGAAVNWDDLWDKENLWVRDFETVTETFPMLQRDELQAFTFREPILCVGGCVKVPVWAVHDLSTVRPHS